jgi:hypothetical protein
MDQQNKQSNEIEFPFVFLGGSCNPTVWRSNVAIPYLTKKHISYFNPQVENWTPEFVAIENEMKDKCIVNYFHLDNLTNGTASIIEIAYLLGLKKTCIITMEENHPIQEIKEARDYLFELSKYGSCKFYVGQESTEMMKALKYISKMYNKNIFVIKPKYTREKKCFIKNEISNQSFFLKELLEIGFYLGQCKRLSFEPKNNSIPINVPMLDTEILLKSNFSESLIKDMNRPRVFLNSFITNK